MNMKEMNVICCFRVLLKAHCDNNEHIYETVENNTWFHFYYFDCCKLSGNQVPSLKPQNYINILHRHG